MKAVEYRTRVAPEWIDYNGHLQDAYFGLIFSYAVDAFQDAVGFDAAYRKATGCTIYLLEDHKFFLREVKEGADILVRTHLIGLWEKRFLLWSEMLCDGQPVATSELMELHVQQRPKPHGVAIPDDIRAAMEARLMPAEDIARLEYRARAMRG